MRTRMTDLDITVHAMPRMHKAQALGNMHKQCEEPIAKSVQDGIARKIVLQAALAGIL